MDSEIKVGDIVRLNGGSPLLTVTWTGGVCPEVQAAWIDTVGRGHSIRVPAKCVLKIHPLQITAETASFSVTMK